MRARTGAQRAGSRASAVERTLMTARAAAPGRCGCANAARAARLPGSSAAHGAGAAVTAQHASGAAGCGSAWSSPAGVQAAECDTAPNSAAACTMKSSACTPHVQGLSAADLQTRAGPLMQLVTCSWL